MKSRDWSPSSKTSRALAVEQPAREDRRDAGVGVGERLARPVDVEEAQCDAANPVGAAEDQARAPPGRAWWLRRSSRARAACARSSERRGPRRRSCTQAGSQLPRARGPPRVRRTWTIARRRSRRTCTGPRRRSTSRRRQRASSIRRACSAISLEQRPPCRGSSPVRSAPSRTSTGRRPPARRGGRPSQPRRVPCREARGRAPLPSKYSAPSLRWPAPGAVNLGLDGDRARARRARRPRVGPRGGSR